MSSERDFGQPAFAVLDVVASTLPEDRGGLGVVVGVRRYVDGRFTYAIAPLDQSHDEPGGLYGDHQLSATGERVPADHFSSRPGMTRRVVVVNDTYPKAKLRGWFGVITDDLGDDLYEVTFEWANGWKHRTKTREISFKHLDLTAHRLPPEPVPRPTKTSRPGFGERNLRPAHEFDIFDELDQYL